MNVLVSQVVPRSVVSKLGVSQAANNFCFNLFENNCFSEMVSFVPNNVTYKIDNDFDDGVKYFQCRRFRHVGFGFSLNILITSFQIASYLSKKEKIWFYNVSPSNFLAILILRLFFRKNVYIIMADYTPTKKKCSIQYFLGEIIKSTRGIVSLSGRTVFNHHNFKVKAGITPISTISKETVDCINDRSFLLSGRLDDSTGLDLAIDVFKELPEIELYITGNMSQKYLEKISRIQNIQYLGNMGYEDFMKILTSVPISLSLRNPEYRKNENNFPSKILEAFAQNRIVLSSVEYSEIEDFKYFICKYSFDSLTEVVNSIVKMPEEKLLIYTNHKESLKLNFSEFAWQQIVKEVETK